MKKYLHFDHLELAEDISFIKWVKGSKQVDKKDWDAWLKRHPEKADDVERARQIVKGMKFKQDLPILGKKDQIWENVNREIKESVNPKTQSKIKSIFWYGAAAVAAVLTFFFVVNMGPSFDTTVQTPYATVESVTLPDGSEVTVNADTEIKYNTKSWQGNREVHLKGEAFFSVIKGSKFTVKTDNGEVQVLGTSFNVYSRENKLHVLCETGKVAVKNEAKEEILIPNQSVTINGGALKRDDKVAESVKRNNWVNGVYAYNDAELAEVVQEIERQLDVVVSIDNSFLDKRYTGSFNKSNIEAALSEVFWPLGLQYRINDKQVIISK